MSTSRILDSARSPVIMALRTSALRSACLALLIGIVGCAAPERRAAVPRQDTEQATVLGIPNARFWPDTQGPEMVREATAALQRERAAMLRDGKSADELPPANLLAVSGGGDDGAFGAGLLVGWSKSGTRPVFKIVTGVSTGALIAPFAFLGSDYDSALQAVYTEVRPDDIYLKRGIINAVFSDALSNSTPLYRLIQRYANATMLAAIAREYDNGRLLLIGTTNLDVQRPVIWNMGAIAKKGGPEALELFQRILLASASIPGVFPTVMIDVAVKGQHYQEMHVDGGTVSQTFLIPPQIGRLVNFRGPELMRDRHAFIIRNGRLDPKWADTERELLPIAGRAISTMIYYSGYNDTLRIYATSQRDGVDYNLAYIGADFDAPHPEDFNQTYMRTLFEYGYRQGLKGNAWRKAPPLFTEPDGSEGE